MHTCEYNQSLFITNVGLVALDGCSCTAASALQHLAFYRKGSFGASPCRCGRLASLGDDRYQPSCRLVVCGTKKCHVRNTAGYDSSPSLPLSCWAVRCRGEGRQHRLAMRRLQGPCRRRLHAGYPWWRAGYTSLSVVLHNVIVLRTRVPWANVLCKTCPRQLIPPSLRAAYRCAALRRVIPQGTCSRSNMASGRVVFCEAKSA